MRRSRWKAGSTTERHTRQRFEKHVFPRIGDKQVHKVGHRDVLEILTSIWTKNAEAGRKVRERTKWVFDWAYSSGYIKANPAGKVLDGVLVPQPKMKKHYPSLPWREVPGALDIIEHNCSGLVAKLCLRLAILTAVRSGEVRLAHWNEFDLEGKTWIIPAERMKAKREHRVPLSDAAVAVLEQARDLDGGSGFVFPSPRFFFRGPGV